jgi:ABC-type phosphate transport system substrate-binding protein
LKLNKLVALGAACGIAIAGVGVATSASAEPVSNSYSLVGSDTLQDSMNAIVNGTTITGATVRVTSNNKTLGNFDAFGSAAIQTKPAGAFFGRPAGSGAGVTALRASITGANYSGNPAVPARQILGQVDIARSSSGPGGNANANGLLAYVPYGRDAIGFAYKGGDSSWANLTAAQLKAIYECTTTTVGGVTVKPRIPQSGSGTRSFFLGAIGNPTLGSCVSDATGTTPENDASVLGANELIPFSVANWVSQANGATGINTTTTSGVAFGSAVSGQAAFTGTAPNLVPNSSYYSDATFGRDTYLVVEYARITPSDAKYDASLANLVNPGVNNSLTSFGSLSSSVGAVKKKFGFLAPSTTNIQRAYATL